MNEWLINRFDELKSILDRILSAERVPFDKNLRSRLPEQPGLYVIYKKESSQSEPLRAGRTKNATGGLRQRVYQNHLMGDQPGNLRDQIVQDGLCADISDAKAWIRENCIVQFIVVEDNDLRKWAEHFILSVLRPKYSD